VVLPTLLRGLLLSVLPNQLRALARSEVEALLEEALLDKAAHPRVDQERLREFLVNPQPRIHLELSVTPECLEPTSLLLLDLALQQVYLFHDDSLYLDLHYYSQGRKVPLLL
jgi:hypothetical protein